MPVILTIVLAVILLLVILWLGLKIKSKPLAMPQLQKLETHAVSLPAGLPRPVERYYKTVYGDQIPLIQSAVLVGRGKIRPFGLWLPARFVFVHQVGHDYRHYFEATIFGIPFLKVNEGYVGGESFFESPMGTYYNDANTNQGANLALWAEAAWFPSAWVADERANWQAVDDDTAILFVPFEGMKESIIVRFDPTTGLVTTLEAMRYREPGEGKSKILWITRSEAGTYLPGTMLSATGSATWLDQGKPWAFFTLEETTYNLNVRDYIHRRGI